MSDNAVNAAPSKKEFNSGPALFLIIYQSLLLASLPFYLYFSTPSLAMVLVTVAIFLMTGISITGGYHRYFAHKSFKTNTVIEAILLFLGTMTAQGSVLRWAFDHRNHHAYVDTDRDPYSINKGFWYAHFLWIMEKPTPIDPKIVPDLMRNRLVMFQHHYYPFLMIGTNFIVFLLVGWLLNDYLGAFFIATMVRLFVLHHFTWFINSLAHTWGDKPFCKEQSAVDNYLISLVTFGEGYHNYHHTYANDYRNGIRWYHFDPTKWTIWTLNKLGLAYDLKCMDPFTVKKRMVLERKNLLQQQLKQLWYVKKDELEKSIHDMSEKILAEIQEFKTLLEHYKKAKKEKSERELLIQLSSDIQTLKKNIKADWRRWKKLSTTIMRLRPITVE